jgi:hypothetical protein
MDTAGRVFHHMDAQEIADLERATGLHVDEEASWSSADYDQVIAYLRLRAARRTTLPVLLGCPPPGRSRITMTH